MSHPNQPDGEQRERAPERATSAARALLNASTSESWITTAREIGLDAAMRGARADIARGRRPWYQASVQIADDGTYTVSVLGVPEGVVSVTGRKGVDAAARYRIALLLDLDEDSFDVVVGPIRHRRSRL